MYGLAMFATDIPPESTEISLLPYRVSCRVFLPMLGVVLAYALMIYHLFKISQGIWLMTYLLVKVAHLW